MELSDQADEVLEILWVRQQEGGATAVTLGELKLGENSSHDPTQVARVVAELVSAGIIWTDEGQAGLTEKGRPSAANAVRRHRLAERLMADVLETKDSMLEDTACRFEHLLHRGLDERVCTLLGHPKTCPHGKPIPPGKCCRQAVRSGMRLVLRLADMEPGEDGRIAYLHTSENRELQKLMSLGILPGISVKLAQKFPSYVFQVGQSQFAVDEAIARQIYVRLAG